MQFVNGSCSFIHLRTADDTDSLLRGPRNCSAVCDSGAVSFIYFMYRIVQNILNSKVKTHLYNIDI